MIIIKSHCRRIIYCFEFPFYFIIVSTRLAAWCSG